MVPALAAFLPGDDQIGLFQYLQMQHHRTAIHLRKHLAKGPGGSGAILEQIEDFAAANDAPAP